MSLAEAPVDRRVSRTRAALRSAFTRILLSEGYEAVTIERVAAQANVGRSTVYLHFNGKEGILRQAVRGPSSFFAGLIGRAVEPDSLIGILEHLREQRIRNRVFFVEPVKPIWVRALAEMIEPKLAAHARAVRARPLLPLPLIATSIAEAQLAMVGHGLVARPTPSSASLSAAVVAMTGALVASLLGAAPNGIPSGVTGH